MDKILKFMYLLIFSFVLLFVFYDSPKAEGEIQAADGYARCIYKGNIKMNDRSTYNIEFQVNVWRKEKGQDAVGYGVVGFGTGGKLDTGFVNVENYDDIFHHVQSQLIDTSLFYENGKWKCADKIYFDSSRLVNGGDRTKISFVKNDNVDLSLSLSETDSKIDNSENSSISTGDDSPSFSKDDSVYNKDDLQDPNATSTDDIKNWGQNYDKKYSTDETNKTAGCDLIKDDIRNFLHDLFFYLSIAGVLIVVVMTIFDLFKVITGNVDDAMKKFLKGIKARIITLVVLLLLPMLIDIVTGTVNRVAEISGYNSSDPMCGVVNSGTSSATGE